MNLRPSTLDRFFLHLLWHDHHAILVGDDQIVWCEAHAIDFDGHIDVDDALAVAAVIDASPASENRKAHPPHWRYVASGSVDDSSQAAAIPGRRRQQFAPYSRMHGATRRRDDDFIRP